jgi:hypothetical protein
MGILDRLKPKPRWQHADPLVRRKAIAELEDALALAELAERDPDTTVRSLALARILDVVVLGRVSSSDADQTVREAAADRLLELALAPDNPAAEAAAGQLSDVRRVSLVARSTAGDGVREVALARLTDERALGGVARQAKIKATALVAAGRLESADELLATALKSEHREVALAAFDRVVPPDASEVDLELLKTLKARSKQKAVARRANSMLQAIEEEREARRRAEEERHKQAASLCYAVEKLAGHEDPDRIAAELEHLGSQWEALATTDAAARRRFDAGVEAARRRIAGRRTEIQAALDAERRRREALAGHEELCRRVEGVQGGYEDGTAQEMLSSLEEEWGQLGPPAGHERDVERLAARFAAAARACRERLARQAALVEARAALESLVAEAESLAAGHGRGAAERWRALTRQARGPAATLEGVTDPPTELLDRLAAAGKAIEARAAEAREAASKAAKDRAEQLAQLLARAERAVGAENLTSGEGERLLRDVAAALADDGKEATTRNIAATLAALRPVQEQLTVRVRELRELDEWRRFGNVQRQEELIAAAQAVASSLEADEEAGNPSDLAAAATALRDLQAQWRAVADVPRHSAQELWDRFKTATDSIRERCEVHFAELRQERSANLAAKEEIVAEAEALADSTDWGRTAARLQELRGAWDAIGPVPREAGRALGQRFRTTCNTFFNRRRDDLNSRKSEWAENLARKEALCQRAEELAESTEWDSAASELKQLQAEWKAIGPVQRAVSEAVWKRFRAAADGFFARYHSRHEAAAAERLAEHEALVVALEALVALEEAPDDLGEQVQTLRTTIANAPHVEGAAAKALHERWMAGLGTLVSRSPAAFEGTDLDPMAIRARLERLVAKVESLVGEEAPAAQEADKSPAESLAERLQAALEKNALGVRADDERWRAAGRAVEEAREAWQRLLWLPGMDTGALEQRFEAACTQVMEQVERHVGPTKDPFAEFGRGDAKRRSPRRKGSR